MLVELRLRQLMYGLGGNKGAEPQMITLPGEKPGRAQSSMEFSGTPVTVEEMNKLMGW